MNSYSFAQMKVVGKWAVDRLTERWQNFGYVVTNVEDDKVFQPLDIYVILTGPSPRTYIEVKGDRYTSGNIYVETVADEKRNSPGCLTYTAADYLAYYLVKQGQCLMIPVPALQAWITEHIGRFQEKTVRSTYNAGRSSTGRGRPVPITVILQEVHGAFLLDGLPVMTEEAN